MRLQLHRSIKTLLRSEVESNTTIDTAIDSRRNLLLIRKQIVQISSFLACRLFKDEYNVLTSSDTLECTLGQGYRVQNKCQPVSLKKLEHLLSFYQCGVNRYRQLAYSIHDR